MATKKRDRNINFAEVKGRDRTMRRPSELLDPTPLEKTASKRRRKSTFAGMFRVMMRIFIIIVIADRWLHLQSILNHKLSTTPSK